MSLFRTFTAQDYRFTQNCVGFHPIAGRKNRNNAIGFRKPFTTQSKDSLMAQTVYLVKHSAPANAIKPKDVHPGIR